MTTPESLACLQMMAVEPIDRKSLASAGQYCFAMRWTSSYGVQSTGGMLWESVATVVAIEQKQSSDYRSVSRKEATFGLAGGRHLPRVRISQHRSPEFSCDLREYKCRTDHTHIQSETYQLAHNAFAPL